jgi:hypothetical protein
MSHKGQNLPVAACPRHVRCTFNICRDVAGAGEIDYIDATLAALFALVVVATVIYALISIRKALGSPRATAVEIGLAGAVAGGSHA